MTKYATGTSVPAKVTKAEIEALLEDRGATAIGTLSQGQHVAILFELNERRVKLTLALPAESDFRFTPGRGIERSAAQRRAAYEAEVRRLWRALLLVLKAKFAAIDDGISSFDREFMPDIVLPNDQTVGQWLLPQVERAYQSLTMPPFLLEARNPDHE